MWEMKKEETEVLASWVSITLFISYISVVTVHTSNNHTRARNIRRLQCWERSCQALISISLLRIKLLRSFRNFSIRRTMI
jgi:hypothetical protein